MESNKLLELIKKFDKDQFKRFGDFVKSPYFNKLKNLIKLYEYLAKYYPGFSDKNFTKENIFAAVCAGEKYNDGRMRTLYSRLLSLAEKFLAYDKYSKDEINLRLDIINETRKIGNVKLQNETIEEIDDLISKYPFKDENYFYYMYKSYYEKNAIANYFLSQKRFDKEADNLALYFVITFLKIYTTALNSLQSVNIELDSKLANDVVRMIEREPFKSNPAIKMQYNLYNLLQTDDEKYFFEQLKLMDEHPDILNPSEMYETFIVLLNFCVIRIQRGFSGFARHKFDLYKTMLEKNVPMMENNYFSYTFFNNIVTSALEMREFEWGENFIEEYKHKLDRKFKDDVVNLCYAKLNYFLKRYEEALRNLSLCGTNENVYYKLAIKDIQIKILYELGHNESIFSIIDSYKHFFHKNRFLVKQVKDRYKIFLKHLNDLMKLKVKGNKENIEIFKQKLNSEPSFLYKDWIVEKVKEYN